MSNICINNISQTTLHHHHLLTCHFIYESNNKVVGASSQGLLNTIDIIDNHCINFLKRQEYEFIVKMVTPLYDIYTY